MNRGKDSADRWKPLNKTKQKYTVIEMKNTFDVDLSVDTLSVD